MEKKNLKLQHLGLYIFFYKNILDFKINFDMKNFQLNQNSQQLATNHQQLIRCAQESKKMPKIKSY